MPKIDISQIDAKTGSSYPAPHDKAVEGRTQWRLGDAGGLSQFGANLVRLDPGAASSLRHWHEKQDEFLVVTEGVLVLVDDRGETELHPGDCCAFPAGDPNGHHIVNKSRRSGAFVVVGTRTTTEIGWYSDIDMKVVVDETGMSFRRKDDSPIAVTDTDTPPVLDFIGFGHKLTAALLNNDVDLYASLFVLPHTVQPRGGAPYDVSTWDDLVADLDLYHRSLTSHRATDFVREVLFQENTAPDRVRVLAKVDLISGATRIAGPLQVTFCFRLDDNEWKIERVESSMGHVNWFTGKPTEIRSGQFEPK